jgi:HlyD family secretion protein
MVTCLGRIDPEVIRVMPPASSFPAPPPVAEVLIKEGSRVTNGQTLMVLENLQRLRTVWDAARADAQAAELRLERTKGPVRESEIASQAAEVERFQAELELARKDFARAEELHKGGAITQAEFDRNRWLLTAREKESESAQARLASLKQARGLDERIAEAELQSARAHAQHAEAEMNQSLVRAPIDGLVIKILAKPGERPATDGAVELAKTEPMYVTAEIYETDIRYVQPGQRAEMTTPASPEPFKGVVESLGFKVGHNKVQDADPASVADARVVEAKIRLDNNPWASRLIGGRVHVRIFR